MCKIIPLKLSAAELKLENKLVKKYKALIKKGLMTKSEINGMRKALGYCSKLTEDDKQAILNMLNGKKIKISQAHSEQGINYLKKVAFNSKGEPRRTKDFPFSSHDLQILKNFKEFRLVGLDPIENAYTLWGYNSIWRVHSKTTGEYFDYTCGHWGSVYVVNRGFKKGTL